MRIETFFLYKTPADQGAASPDFKRQNEEKLHAIMREDTIPVGHYVLIAKGELIDTGSDLKALILKNPASKLGADVLIHRIGEEFPLEVKITDPRVMVFRTRK